MFITLAQIVLFVSLRYKTNLRHESQIPLVIYAAATLTIRASCFVLGSGIAEGNTRQILGTEKQNLSVDDFSINYFSKLQQF